MWLSKPRYWPCRLSGARSSRASSSWHSLQRLYALVSSIMSPVAGQGRACQGWGRCSQPCAHDRVPACGRCDQLAAVSSPAAHPSALASDSPPTRAPHSPAALVPPSATAALWRRQWAGSAAGACARRPAGRRRSPRLHQGRLTNVDRAGIKAYGVRTHGLGWPLVRWRRRQDGRWRRAPGGAPPAHLVAPSHWLQTRWQALVAAAQGMAGAAGQFRLPARCDR